MNYKISKTNGEKDMNFIHDIVWFNKTNMTDEEIENNSDLILLETMDKFYNTLPDYKEKSLINMLYNLTINKLIIQLIKYL